VFRILPTPECLYLSYLISWTLTFVVQFVAFRKLYRQHTARLA
jgi:hypothetical protein